MLRHGGANPSFSTLTPSFFETRIESDNLLLPGVPPSRSVPLCPLLNVSSIPRFDLLFLDSFFCAPLPLPSLCLSRSTSSACCTSTYPSSCPPSRCVLSALHFFPRFQFFLLLYFCFTPPLSGSSILFFVFFCLSPDGPCCLESTSQTLVA